MQRKDRRVDSAAKLLSIAEGDLIRKEWESALERSVSILNDSNQSAQLRLRAAAIVAQSHHLSHRSQEARAVVPKVFEELRALHGRLLLDNISNHVRSCCDLQVSLILATGEGSLVEAKSFLWPIVVDALEGYSGRDNMESLRFTQTAQSIFEMYICRVLVPLSATPEGNSQEVEEFLDENTGCLLCVLGSLESLQNRASEMRKNRSEVTEKRRTTKPKPPFPNQLADAPTVTGDTRSVAPPPSAPNPWGLSRFTKLVGLLLTVTSILVFLLRRRLAGVGSVQRLAPQAIAL